MWPLVLIAYGCVSYLKLFVVRPHRKGSPRLFSFVFEKARSDFSRIIVIRNGSSDRLGPNLTIVFWLVPIAD